jgi:formylglycine-generating enzyme required for sulfatase activity
VVLATDAPVPQLGQQIYVELLDAQGQDASTPEARLLDGSRPELWPVSFGLVPSSSTDSPRLRVRLYRLDETGSDGTPQGTALIDATAELSPVSSGISTVAMTLAMNCFGVAPDLPGKRTCDPSTGSLAPEPLLPEITDLGPLPAAGSWPPAAVQPCSGAPPSGMVCVPGGAFLMGAAHFYPIGGGLDPAPQHVVSLSPFAIDIDEMTVGATRSLVNTRGLLPPLMGDPDASASPPACTYLGGTDPSHDDLPINCVSWSQANEACKLLGKRLPTEAEWEYVAGNTGLGTPYPWGADPDPCAYAIVARGRPELDLSFECEGSSNGYAWGPVAGGSPMDATVLGVLNLGGNMNEWVADIFAPYSSACWNTGTYLVDPRCASPSVNGHALRGGSWQSDAFEARISTRGSVTNDALPLVSAGFRCAVDL